MITTYVKGVQRNLEMYEDLRAFCREQYGKADKITMKKWLIENNYHKCRKQIKGQRLYYFYKDDTTEQVKSETENSTVD